MNPQQFIGIITGKSQLTKNVFHFFIKNEKPTELVFQPGQYATFIIDSQTRRQYSFCSAPDRLSFEIVVDITPMGIGSKYFLEKNVGDRVEYLAPLGNFILNDNPLKKILVATGTGIAPFRSMLLNELSTINNQPTTLSVSLYWGLRYEDDVYWDNEFRNLAGQYAGFQYFLVLSKPSQNWKGLMGHVTDFVLQNTKNLENSEFYLCGNNAMIIEMESKLSAQNINKGRIKKDLFY